MPILNCDLQIKNYRPFIDEHPASLPLRHKYIALVGLNNAGKSALLRFFWELKPGFELLRDPQRLFNATSNRMAPYSVPTDSARTTLNDRPLSFSLSLAEPAQYDISRVTYTLAQGLAPKLEVYRGNDRVDLSKARFDDWREHLHAISAEGNALHSAIYAGPFRNAIAVTGEPYFGLEIGKGFIEKFDNLKASTHDPKSRRMVRDIIDEIKTAFNFKHLNIEAARGNDTLIIEDERGSHTLLEVGAGLSQFLILVLHAAVNRPRLMVIDEPELNLHPALQVKLLNMLGLYAGTILFSTHNIGLARTLAQRRHLVVKDPAGFARITDEHSNPSLVEILGELSYSGRHDLGVNAVLWVEGGHDVPVIQHFLALMGKEHQVLVLPLHGRNGIQARSVEQLHELKRVSPHVYVLIDSEKKTATDEMQAYRVEFLRRCAEARITASATEYRAIENYFPGRAIKEAFDVSYSALEPYEKLNEAKRPWDKADNYKIALEMKPADLNNDVGRFLGNIDISTDRPTIVQSV